MNVLHRFFRMARADAHGVLDALEDRTLLIRQSLREAELALECKRARHAEVGARLKGHGREHERLAAREAELDRDVALALERGETELARFSARRLLGTRRQRERSELELRETRGALDELARTLASQERELEELRQNAEAELAREQARRAASCGAPDATFESATAGAGIRDEEVELELLRRQSATQPREVRS